MNIFSPIISACQKFYQQEKVMAQSIADYPAGILLKWFKMSARLGKILLICFITRLMFIKQTFLKPL